MSDTEGAVARHYTTGELSDRVLSALKALGIDPDKATAADLKAGDEFHTGGVQATDHFFSHLEVTSGMRVLDVGAGIGGTSRYIADRYGAHVTGVDLTPEFVETATELSARVGLGDKITFHHASALDMPVPDTEFDLAVLMHVGMNIADKKALFAEVSRTLKPGGTFAVFDVMKGEADEPLTFPVPWADRSKISFLALPDDYVAVGKAAGLHKTLEHDRSDFAKRFFEEAFAHVAAHGPSPLGIHLMMGETAGEKFANYVENLKTKRLRPVEIIFRKET